MAWKGSYAGDSAPHPTLPRYSSRRTRNPREDRRKESLRHGCGHSHRRSPASWSRAVGRNRCEAQRGLHLRPRKCHPGLGPPPATHGPEGAGLAALAPRCTGRYAGFNRQVCASTAKKPCPIQLDPVPLNWTHLDSNIGAGSRWFEGYRSHSKAPSSLSGP